MTSLDALIEWVVLQPNQTELGRSRRSCPPAGPGKGAATESRRRVPRCKRRRGGGGLSHPGLHFDVVEPPRYHYTVLFNASYNGYDIIDVRRKPDGRNEVCPHRVRPRDPAPMAPEPRGPPWSRLATASPCSSTCR